MRYGSVCSGVEAASVAWEPLGYKPQWFSEIEKFPSAVLQHHYPHVPNHGDMTKFKEWNNEKTIDLLVGGTPCQSFSVAGLRQGLNSPNGNLMLTYLSMAEQLKPKWLVWENVPGVLSSNGGRDFATFLTAMGKIGYGFAYRVLDAQYFGVPQRRRRVFVVGCLGDWRSAASVLFESESLSGHPAPSREKRQRVAPTVGTGAPYSRTGNARVEAVTYALPGNWIGRKPENGGNQVEPFVELSPCQTATDVHAVAYEHHAQGSRVKELPEVCSTVTAKYGTGGGNMPIVASSENQHVNSGAALFVPGKPTGKTNQAYSFDSLSSNSMKSKNPKSGCRAVDLAKTIDTSDQSPSKNQGGLGITHGNTVRRMTPRECERLQGFPDDYTQIPWRGKEPEDCPNGHRYKAMGNSMAVPVMKWIGERIQDVDLTQYLSEVLTFE